jgi:hypothetical protein
VESVLSVGRLATSPLAHIAKSKRTATMKLYKRIAVILLTALAIAVPEYAFTQVTGEPVTSSGQPALSGQPYKKTHKRHNKNFYGIHSDPFKHSKGSH